MEKPNYYAILPANIRYDNNLKANEKLIYAEITALSNKNGYCYATNNYFAKLYDVHKITVSNWIKNLKEKGYVKVVEIHKKDSKEIQERRIYISQSLIPISEKTNTPLNEKTNTPISENTKDNNTSINTTSKNIYIDDFFNKSWDKYPNKKGKGKISKSKKEEVYKLGDEFLRCIDRYVEEVEEKRKSFPELKYQYGSTFYNSGYVDYLDVNYKDTVEKEGPLGVKPANPNNLGKREEEWDLDDW